MRMVIKTLVMFISNWLQTCGWCGSDPLVLFIILLLCGGYSNSYAHTFQGIHPWFASPVIKRTLQPAGFQPGFLVRTRTRWLYLPAAVTPRAGLPLTADAHWPFKLTVLGAHCSLWHPSQWTFHLHEQASSAFASWGHRVPTSHELPFQDVWLTHYFAVLFDLLPTW